MTFGEALRAARTARGLSQEKAARELDVTVMSWNRWENDKAIPREGMWDRLVEVYPGVAEHRPDTPQWSPSSAVEARLISRTEKMLGALSFPSMSEFVALKDRVETLEDGAISPSAFAGLVKRINALEEEVAELRKGARPVAAGSRRKAVSYSGKQTDLDVVRLAADTGQPPDLSPELIAEALEQSKASKANPPIDAPPTDPRRRGRRS